MKKSIEPIYLMTLFIKWRGLVYLFSKNSYDTNKPILLKMNCKNHINKIKVVSI